MVFTAYFWLNVVLLLIKSLRKFGGLVNIYFLCMVLQVLGKFDIPDPCSLLELDVESFL